MSITRRRFVQGSMLAAGSMALPLGAPARVRGANDQIRVAVIGLNGRGWTLVDWVMEVAQADQSVKLVATCDTDQAVLDRETGKMEQKYNIQLERERDFRRLLDRQDIDAVCVATPNHWHSLMSIMAVQAGKDVYVEKQVSHNVWEGRQLVRAARRHNRIVQTGTQSRSSPALHQAHEFLHSGQLGKIQYALGLCYKPRGPVGKRSSPLQIPASVDYDMWCGPAAKVELYRNQLHYDWHWDFNTGNGDLGNQGIHQMDIARWFLGERALSPRIVGLGGRLGYEDASDTPNTELVLHDYPAAPLIFEVRGLPAEARHRINGEEWSKNMDHIDATRIGVIIYCEGGRMIIPSYASAKAVDTEGKTIKPFSGGGDHMANFFQCIRSRKPAELFADIEEGHLSSALCHTGNISYRLGERLSAPAVTERIRDRHAFAEAFGRMAEHLKRNEVDIASSTLTLGPWLEMDPRTERFTNNEHANKLLTREYRKPFVVPDLLG